MKDARKTHGMVVLAAAVAAASSPVGAGILPGFPVYDAANLAAAEINIATNAAQVVELAVISKQLSSGDEGTVIHHTVNVDKSTTNIDNSITKNTEINTEFHWHIAEHGEEIIPIPFEVQQKLDQVRAGQSAEQFTSHYRSVDDYDGKALGQFGDATAREASRARKAANDALAAAIERDEVELAGEAEAVKELGDLTRTVVGHGNQMQVANALSAAQINQLAKLRSMMLISETARVTELQAKADKEARAVAIGKQLRSGLEDAMERTRTKSVIY